MNRNTQVSEAVWKYVKILILLMCTQTLVMDTAPVCGQNLISATESVSPIGKSTSWNWEVTLTAGKSVPNSPSLPSSLGSGTLSWIPEIDAEGIRMGWNLTLGDPSNNLLIDSAIAHGPQPCQFYGWQFLPIQDGPLGLNRSWKLPGGTLRVLVLDYAVNKVVLSRLRVRLEWTENTY